VLLIVYKECWCHLSDIQNFVTVFRKQSAARKVCIIFLVIKLIRLRQPSFCDGNTFVMSGTAIGPRHPRCNAHSNVQMTFTCCFSEDDDLCGAYVMPLLRLKIVCDSALHTQKSTRSFFKTRA